MLVVLANLLAVLGLGPYFPWAVPALYAQAKDSLVPASLPIALLAGLAGMLATYAWWMYADQSQPDDLQHTARMLGCLYDGIECQGLAPGLVEVVSREAGVPVYDGLASDGHATARLAGMIGGNETPARLRQLVLQTVLLSTLA
jgi:hypothetical protein